MATSAFTVTGMTCDHCVRSVTEEVGEVRGVSEVRVDLGTGVVEVSGDQPLDDAAIRAAIEEAGYTVV
ncbi:copper ion binding protein [Sphaerisporangium sp. TRM90804]|uniref:heavy-metal-associated domain-containing protein n=1 Tax=Sphaerisporangium sp. TRM90804 TaxID=3031113 RepID=UPI00244C4CC7|nr:copper ion binding protein [Sphaerisporangium sp. TRM90804]MDH2429401.1 copper ion binding protein [Sphaerisporangium sp. TRM90804]